MSTEILQDILAQKQLSSLIYCVFNFLSPLIAAQKNINKHTHSGQFPKQYINHALITEITLKWKTSNSEEFYELYKTQK